MALSKEIKTKIKKKFATHDGDTGSPEIQIALLTKEIESVSGHLKDHKKDKSARRGLLKMVGKRRRIIEYLKTKDENRFKELEKKLDF